MVREAKEIFRNVCRIEAAREARCILCSADGKASVEAKVAFAPAMSEVRLAEKARSTRVEHKNSRYVSALDRVVISAKRGTASQYA